MGWLAEEVLEHAPQYSRPGDPAIANHPHLNHRDVHNDMSPRRTGLQP